LVFIVSFEMTIFQVCWSNFYHPVVRPVLKIYQALNASSFSFL